MMMKMIRANWVDLAQGCGVVAGIFLAIHLITAGVLFWGHPDSSVTISGIALPAAGGDNAEAFCAIGLCLFGFAEQILRAS